MAAKIAVSDKIMLYKFMVIRRKILRLLAFF